VLNIAVTLLAASIVTAHVVAVPEQALQPEKVDPVAAVAVKVTETPELNEALQVVPQLLMPAGFDVIVPEPVPDLVTVRVYWVVGLGRLQEAVPPPFEPRHCQRYSVLESAVSFNVPTTQALSAVPHWPLIDGGVPPPGIGGMGLGTSWLMRVLL